MLPVLPPAVLALADGTVFRGTSIGGAGHTAGEVVFNTALTGYQEILTDPSYCRHIVTLTYPHIGNYGVNAEDVEAAKVFAAGLGLKDLPLLASNFRRTMTLAEYLAREGTVAIADIDTRMLTRRLRSLGAQNGCIMAFSAGTQVGQKIVNILLEDGRMPASEVARRLGDISERAVRYRMDRMVNEGVIRISAVAKPQAFGLVTIADVWMEVESDRIVEVAKRMTEFDNVSYVACGIGESDVSIQIVAKDTAEIYQFVTEVVRKISGVRNTTTSIVPLILKDVYQWRVPERIAKEIAEGKVAASD